jgi:UDP-N-acetylmuramate: L-alanyl-gamma-D-glutamyl-meso-diaminopimelate ligase
MSVVDALRCFIFKNKKVIVIAGTHGKTTTTGMLVHVLKGCKMNPGYLIGGVDCVSGRCAELGEG